MPPVSLPKQNTITVCFFGITRSLKYTLPSIEKNIIRPARQHGNVVILAHFFNQPSIYNPRSGERGHLDTEEHKVLQADQCVVEEPDSCLEFWKYSELKSYGDSWHDGFRSMRNLVHQLHSLNEVTKMALSGRSDVCLFCRPDLEYHDDLSALISQALAKPGPEIVLPNWQAHGGLNDRFAICAGREAAKSYGMRVQLMHQYCRETGLPVHSEKLLKYAAVAGRIPTRTVFHRASRVRFDGTIKQEDFYHPYMAALRDIVKPYFPQGAAGGLAQRLKNAIARMAGRKPM